MSIDPDDTQSQTLTHLATTRMADTRGAAQLVVLTGIGAGRRIILDREVILGRGAQASVKFEEMETVSRRHVSIKPLENGTWYLQDLGSSNGTSINGTPVEKAVLRFGDKIRLGASTVLMFGRNDPLEEQLFEAQRLQLLGKLAAGIAHDFNNVLGSVLTNASYLADPGRLAPGELAQCVQDIRLAGRQGAALAAQLLTFASPSADEERAASVAQVADEVVRILRRTLRQNVTLVAEVPAGLAVACAPSVVLQLIMNLCVNAVDAMPDGGTVTIGAAARDVGFASPGAIELPMPGPHVVISVQDTGIGMDARTRSRVFEPFFTTKPRGKGTGLGLATVAKIALEHGGYIDLRSELGQGTRFDVYLPAALEEPARPPDQGVETGAGLRGTILIVDDNELIRTALGRALSRAGMKTLIAVGGAEALALYAAHMSQIRLVLLDIDMPGMGGEATLTELRAIDPNVRVMISSGGVDSDEMSRLRDAGVIGFLHKPFDITTLVSTLAQLDETDSR